MSSQASFVDAWIRRDAFYEERVFCRPRENARFYQQLVRRYYSFLVPSGAHVLEMGCGLGDLLAEVKPSHGVGVDFSARTIALARERHPEFEFHVGDAARWGMEKSGNRESGKAETEWAGTWKRGNRGGENAEPEPGKSRESGNCERGKAETECEKRENVTSETRHVSRFSDFPISAFPDYILLADLINDLPDVQAVFEHVRTLSQPHTRLVLNFLNTVWRPALAIAEWIGAKAPSLLQNWLSTADVKNLLLLAGWEVVKEEHRILWPLRTPILATLLNRWVAPFLPHCCLSIFLVARPRSVPEGIRNGQMGESRDRDQGLGGPSPHQSKRGDFAASSTTGLSTVSLPHFTCSVIIPARNEAGNIESAVLRTAELGLGTELIFVAGHSRDNTWEEAQRIARKYPERNIRVLLQRGKGKGDAVREGFAAAKGELLFILDADLTTPPEELPKFYEVLRSGTAEFINGVRLVYPMEHEAMRFLNMLANKLFGMSFSWLLGQPLKDTLCGTKVLFRTDYERLARNRDYFGDFDPFGDFDLLFGAAKLNLRMIDLPIRYRARTYGESNIQRWRHGWLLLRMVLFGAKRLKFV